MAYSKLSNDDASGFGVQSLKTTLRKEMQCNFVGVRPVAEEVSGFLRTNGCDESKRLDCELALVEACNNAIKCAGLEGSREPVLLEISIDPYEVELRITDHGPGFVWPETVALPDAETESGRGVYLIQVLMDFAAYFRGTNGNTLVLRKRRASS